MFMMMQCERCKFARLTAHGGYVTCAESWLLRSDVIYQRCKKFKRQEGRV